MAGLVEFAGPAGRVSGCLARPGPGAGPGIVVLHSWFGLTGHFHRVADRLAGLGYLVIAPDLYHGESADDEAGARVLRRGLDLDRARGEAVAALQCARELAGLTAPAGVVGFSMGAELAIDVATTVPADVAAAVVFYGVKATPALSRLRAAVQGHFAPDDEFATAAEINEFTSCLAELDKPYESYLYPGTRHAFFNASRPEAYDAPSADLAWRRMVKFLTATLPPRDES